MGVLELFRRTISPYFGIPRIEFQFCCLWIRFDSQGVVCLHSVGFAGSGTVTVIFLNVSRGSTLFVSLYHLPRRHMMSDFFFTVLSAFVLIIVSSVTFLYPRPSPFFYSAANKQQTRIYIYILYIYTCIYIHTYMYT